MLMYIVDLPTAGTAAQGPSDSSRPSLFRPPMPRPLRFLTLCAAVLALAPTGLAQRATDGSRVVSSWQEDVKLADGSDVVYRYEITYDYTTGRTVRTAFDTAGAIVERREIDYAPTPSEEEIAWATDLIRADAELGALAAERNALIEGGFVLHGDQLAACAAPARCLQFDLMSPDRLESIRFVVVDLRTETIVERNLFPDL